MPKAFKFPKAMGACADKIYMLRQERLKAQKIVDEIEAEEKALKVHIIDNLPKSEQTGASGQIANVRVVNKDVPVVQDLDALYEYIRKTKRTDLLQKRLNEGAINEILDAGKTVPGIGVFKAVTLSVTKV